MSKSGPGVTSVNLTEEIKGRLDVIVGRSGLSRSAIIVRLINHGLPQLESDLAEHGASPILLAVLPTKDTETKKTRARKKGS